MPIKNISKDGRIPRVGNKNACLTNRSTQPEQPSKMETIRTITVIVQASMFVLVLLTVRFLCCVNDRIYSNIWGLPFPTQNYDYEP